jgi:hypothetical protein
VRKINTTQLYSLGTVIRPLSDFGEQDRSYGDVYFALYLARSSIERIMADQSLALRTCRQASTALIQAINSVIPKDFNDLFSRNRDEVVNRWQLGSIKDAATRFETVLHEELAISETYVLLQKGAYATSELATNAEVMLPSEIRAVLPQKVSWDLREAGRCLAYETPTASAFHISRAVESCILAYYQHTVGKEAPAKMRNWAVYINAMKQSGKADDRVLNLLIHIKDSYRNPISHPDAVLTADEVVVLIGVAVGAMTQIALAMRST